MQDTKDSIFRQLGINENLQTWESLIDYTKIPENTKVVKQGEPLFLRLEKEEEINYLKNQINLL